jgi:hypothetical protein
VLLILVALVCAYLACWKPTKEQGVKDVAEHVQPIPLLEAPFDVRQSNAQIHNTTTIAPLVVGIDEVGLKSAYRRYYFWFFGLVARLPYERDIEPDEDKYLTDLKELWKNDRRGVFETE